MAERKSGRERRRPSRLFGPPVLVLLVAFVLSKTGFIEQLDKRIADAQRHVLSSKADLREVLVIDVDEESMRVLEPQLGAWPYDRRVYAIVGDYLARQGARLVVFDILFSDGRGGEGDAALADALKKHPNMLLPGTTIPGTEASGTERPPVLARSAWPVRGFRGERSQSALLPLEMFGRAAPTGIITVHPDSDGILRTYPVAIGVKDVVLPSLAMLAVAHPIGDQELEFDNEAGEVRLGERSWPVDDGQNIMFALPKNAFEVPVRSFYRVLLAALGADEYTIPAEELRGRTIFLGSTAAILGDYVQVPGHGRVPGLGMLALVYHALEHGNVYRPPHAAASFAVFALTAIPLLLFPGAVRRRFDVAAGMVLAGFVLAVSAQWLLAALASMQVSLVTPVLTSAMLLGTVVVQRIITNAVIQRRLEMNAMAAKEAAALKGKFLAHMTHELRTPLTAILGYNRILSAPDISPDDRKRHHGVIARSANHLLALINNMLDQSKIEAGQLVLDPEPTDVRAVCEDARSLLQSIADQKRLTLKSEVSRTVPPRLQLDALRLRQILINLMGNALKFTYAGEISVYASWHDGTLRIKVQDTGPGIPPETLARLFVPFQQGSAHIAAEHGGTGLGLTISRNLAQLMGGTLTADSEPGNGATFLLQIPAPVSESRAGPDEGTRELTGRVLLADDNPDNRNLLTLYLQSMGLEVAQASTGTEAIESVQSRPPDLVLMDVQMPEMSGLDATRELRTRGFKAPILALTAHTEAEEHAKAREAGCDAVLVKPVTPEALRETLKQRMSPPGN